MSATPTGVEEPEESSSEADDVDIAESNSAPESDLDAFVLGDPIRFEAARRERIKARQEQFRLGNWSKVRKRDLIWLYPLRMSIQTVREMRKDKLFVRASSLAYFTTLSLVPLLAVSMTLVLGFGNGEDGNNLLGMMQDYLLPMAGDKVTGFLTNAMERATSSQLGPMGALALMFTSIGLFLQIERVFNDIWEVKNRRAILFRVLIFYAIITSVPFLVSLSIYQAALIDVERLGAASRVMHAIAPIAATAAIFFAMYKFLPNTKVRWQYALINAVLMALVFEGAKSGFKLYIDVAFPRNYGVIYGALGFIPVLLIWIYLSWIIILFGSELAYCQQHLRHLMLSDKVDRKLASADRNVVSSLIAVEVMAPVARAFTAGSIPIELDRICAESGYPRELVRMVMERLCEAKIVIIAETPTDQGYLPARPLESVLLSEVVAPFDVEERKLEHTFAVREVLTETRELLHEKLGTKSLADLT